MMGLNAWDREVTLSAIEPCPFCGVAPEVRPWHGGRTARYLIGCYNETDCWVLPWFVAPTRKKAIKRWNTRAEVKP